MPKYIAFLRAINVGGHVVKMETLRELFVSFGFTDAETFIASGNVVFNATGKNAVALEKKIATGLEAALGYPVATFLRTDAELARIAVHQPFRQVDREAAAAFNIAFIKEPLNAPAMEKLMTFKTDIDDFAAHEREIYWLCRKKQSESTFSNAVFERRMGIQATFRGANTIAKMAARYASALR